MKLKVITKRDDLQNLKNQSIEKKSATANTSAKDISDKTKKQVKGKKGKVSRQLRNGIVVVEMFLS